MDRDEMTGRSPAYTQDPGGGYALVLAGPPPAVVTLPTLCDAILGRQRPADIIVADDSVSRRHARIICSRPPEIEDLGSTNGTKVMGRRLGPGERVPIPFGSVIEIGGVVAFVRPVRAAESIGEIGRSMPVPPPAPSATETASLKRTIAPPPPAPRADAREVILRDAAMLRLYELIDVIAPSKLSVLILGETGVGKDVYAETLHRRSPRGSGPFVRLNCAALPENLLEAELFGFERGAFTGAIQSKPGLFEAADGGTVFLDEIGEMPLVTQAKLLRVLESGEVMRVGSVKPRRVDVRFVSATNRDLETLSATGQFRSDLFFRLNGVSVTLRPLRKRPDDIMPLALHFLEHIGANATFTPEAAKDLTEHRWPGNIRELKNVVERAALLAQGGPIRREHLLFKASLDTRPQGFEPAPPSIPPFAPPPPQTALREATRAPAPAVAAPPPPPPPAPAGVPAPIRDQFAELERVKILEAMERCGGNQSRAAKLLGISRTTLIKRLEAYQYVRPRKGQED